MSRLEKKCLVASTGAHAIVALLLPAWAGLAYLYLLASKYLPMLPSRSRAEPSRTSRARGEASCAPPSRVAVPSRQP